MRLRNLRAKAKRNSQIMVMDRCKISVLEVVLGAPDRVNIACLMHDTRLCQMNVTMTNNKHGTKQI